jgi:hypothetical protein
VRILSNGRVTGSSATRLHPKTDPSPGARQVRRQPDKKRASRNQGAQGSFAVVFNVSGETPRVRPFSASEPPCIACSVVRTERGRGRGRV